MAILVECPCGRRLRAADEQAGREMRCGSCQALVRVPDADAGRGEYAVEQVRRCKGCRREWPPETVVCVECGYHFEKGRRLKTTYRLIEKVIEVGSAWAGTYARYRVWRDGRGKPMLSVARRLLFIPCGGATYELSAYRWVQTDFQADDEDGGTFYLELGGPGRREAAIFASADERKMHELVDAMASAGLEVRRK